MREHLKVLKFMVILEVLAWRIEYILVDNQMLKIKSGINYYIR